MLNSIPVTEEFEDYGRILALYERAFPVNERRPLKPLLHDPTGCADFLAFYAGTEFVGFACLLTWKDLTHILYIAMDEDKRGRGYGAQALEIVRNVRPGHRVLADLEEETDGAENGDQRRKRMQFYMRNGFEWTEVAYRWRGEDYVILSQGGTVTKEEFWGFWHFFECENTAFSQF